VPCSIAAVPVLRVPQGPYRPRYSQSLNKGFFLLQISSYTLSHPSGNQARLRKSQEKNKIKIKSQSYSDTNFSFRVFNKILPFSSA